LNLKVFCFKRKYIQFFFIGSPTFQMNLVHACALETTLRYLFLHFSFFTWAINNNFFTIFQCPDCFYSVNHSKAKIFHMKNSIIILEKKSIFIFLYLKVKKRYFLLEQTISSVIILDRKSLFFIPETKKKLVFA
jgi:hypothetical protein